MIAIHPNAEAHAQDALLARLQACKHLSGGLTQIGLDRGIEWRDRALVLDEIAQAAVLLLANRQAKAERLLGDIQHLAHPFERHRQLLGKLFGGRLAADLVHHLPARFSPLFPPPAPLPRAAVPPPLPATPPLHPLPVP